MPKESHITRDINALMGTDIEPVDADPSRLPENSPNSPAQLVPPMKPPAQINSSPAKFMPLLIRVDSENKESKDPHDQVNPNSSQKGALNLANLK